MKISEIKSDEVRNEAVRLAIHKKIGYCKSQEEAMNSALFFAFDWRNQNSDFWFKLRCGTTPNTPDLKLPNF
jgi:hypothetical protein